MLRQLLPAAVLFGATLAATPSFAGINLDIKYTTTNVSNVGTQIHHGLLKFVLVDNDVKVYDLADGQHKLIATRSSGKGFLFGPVQFGVSLDTNVVDLYGVYSSHTLHAHVTTDGQSSCAAEITNTLKAGHTVYKYVYPKVGPVDVYKATISDVSCEFSRGEDDTAPGAKDKQATEAKPATERSVAVEPNATSVAPPHHRHHLVHADYVATYDYPRHPLRAAIRRFLWSHGF